MIAPTCPRCRIPLAPRILERRTGEGKTWPESHSIALRCPRCGSGA